MKLHFFKYEGAGNDFIVLDNRSQDIVLGEKEIRKTLRQTFRYWKRWFNLSHQWFNGRFCYGVLQSRRLIRYDVAMEEDA